MANTLALNYTGAWHDSVIDGLPLGNGYRTYLPDLMRFTAPDPLSPFAEGGVNPYVYCSGDPINFSDPSGQLQLSWTGGLGIIAALLGISLAAFTGGSSLAIAGAVLGAASAATGVAADNTEGTVHKALMGISIATGVASGMADIASIVTSMAKNMDSALQLAGGLGRHVRAKAAVTTPESVTRHSIGTQTVAIRDLARHGERSAEEMHELPGPSQANAEMSEGSSASTRGQEAPAQSSHMALGDLSLEGWLDKKGALGYTTFVAHFPEQNIAKTITLPNQYVGLFERTFSDRLEVAEQLDRYRKVATNLEIPLETRMEFGKYKILLQVAYEFEVSKRLGLLLPMRRYYP